jgi:O-antigen ligase
MFKEINFDYLFKKSNFFEKLVFFVPISLVIGNFAINLNIILIILSFFLLVYLKKISLIRFFNNKLFFAFCIFGLLNIYISIDMYISSKAYLGILKHYLFFLALIFFFKKKQNFESLSFIFFIVFNFVLFDTLFQFITGKDIFGYESLISVGRDITSVRLSGPFGDELIVGGFLKNIFIISLSMYLIIKKNYIFYFYLFFTLIVVFLSGERVSSFMFLLFTLIFLFFFDYSLKKKIFLILVVFTTFSFTFYSNENLRKSTFDRTFKQLGIIESTESYKNHKNFWDSQWGAHFLTAYYIFNDKKIIGSGAKTFRVECKNEKYNDINSARAKSRCATHPHNMYLEIISETGIIGLMFFIYFIYRIFFLQIRNSFKENSKYYNFNLSLLCMFIILVFPIQTTGSFFSTYNGFFYWFYAAVIHSNKYLTK